MTSSASPGPPLPAESSRRRTIPRPEPPDDVVTAERPEVHVPSSGRASGDAVTTGRLVEQPVDRTLAGIAAGQHGLVTRRQALAAGVGPGAIRDRLRRGALHREHRGVYLVGHPVRPPLAREHGALLACGPRALVARRSAAAIWRLLEPRPADAVEVLVVGRRTRSRSGISVGHTADLTAAEVRRVDGVAVTSPARTIVDLAAGVSARELERLVHEAQVLRLASPRAVLTALDRAGPVAGAAALRALVGDDTRGVTRSEAERALLRLVLAAGLPEPRLNARVGAFMVDAWWPSRRLVVEVDGFRFHGTRRAFERDRRRDAELQAAGQRVVRVTWRQLRREPLAVAASLATLLAAPVTTAPDAGLERAA
jgi:very-short-patch-repair endonuclease